MRGGEIQASPGQRDAFGADRGLCAGPLAGSKRRVDQARDGRAGSACRVGRRDRGLDLGDDLILTDGHRVQAARDREQVLSGRAAAQDPCRPHDLIRRDMPAGGQQIRHRPGHPSGWRGHSGVDLHSITGRQDHRLVDSRHRMQPGQHFAELSGRHGKLLQNLGRNEPVSQAQAHNRHRDGRSVSGVSLSGPSSIFTPASAYAMRFAADRAWPLRRADASRWRRTAARSAGTRPPQTPCWPILQCRIDNSRHARRTEQAAQTAIASAASRRAASASVLTGNHSSGSSEPSAQRAWLVTSARSAQSVNNANGAWSRTGTTDCLTPASQRLDSLESRPTASRHYLYVHDRVCCAALSSRQAVISATG